MHCYSKETKKANYPCSGEMEKIEFNLENKQDHVIQSTVNSIILALIFKHNPYTWKEF